MVLRLKARLERAHELYSKLFKKGYIGIIRGIFICAIERALRTLGVQTIARLGLRV